MKNIWTDDINSGDMDTTKLSMTSTSTGFLSPTYILSPLDKFLPLPLFQHVDNRERLDKFVSLFNKFKTERLINFFTFYLFFQQVENRDWLLGKLQLI